MLTIITSSCSTIEQMKGNLDKEKAFGKAIDEVLVVAKYV